jgi:hypothetical protein
MCLDERERVMNVADRITVTLEKHPGAPFETRSCHKSADRRHCIEKTTHARGQRAIHAVEKHPLQRCARAWGYACNAWQVFGVECIIAKRNRQKCQRCAPRVARRRFTTEQRIGFQRCDAFEP